MATVQQKALAQNLVDESSKPLSKRRTKRELLLDSGYAPNTAIKPSQVFRAKTFLELADDIGLTDDFLLQALKDDIDNKPKNRKAEIELAFKVKGAIEGDKSGDTYNTQVNVVDSTPRGEMMEKAFIDFMKMSTLPNSNVIDGVQTSDSGDDSVPENGDI